MVGAGGVGAVKRCVICGSVLDRLDAAVGSHCRTLQCRTIAAVRIDQERRRVAVERDTAVADAHFRPAGIDRVARLPAVTRSVVAADPDRTATFRRTLADAMAAASALVPEGEATEPAEGSGGGVFQLACTACGGYCCRHGGTHAFLTPTHLAERLRREPDLTPETLARDYLDRLPERAVEWSCVFHGEAGCALDRRLRSDICNQYLCESILALTTLLGDGPVGLAAMEDGRVVRSTIV